MNLSYIWNSFELRLELINKTFLIILFLFLSLSNFRAQELFLEITSTKKKEALILNAINYQKKHIDSTSIKLEIKKISDNLKELGFFLNNIDCIKIIKNKYLVYYSLQQRILEAKINLGKYSELLLLKENKTSLSIPINNLKPTLTNLSKKLEKQGRTFSKLKLKNITLKDSILHADLEILSTKKRVIDKVILKGYRDFPKKYLKHFFKITNKTIFNKEKITNISLDSKNLTFAKQIKEPEILFTKDSTLLYMYFKKIKNNSFNGIVNFSTEDDGKLLLNGNINLKLNNTFNNGEQINLFWNSVQKERQELKLTSEIPFIFNTKLTPKLIFSIYKQDSSFVNINMNTDLYFYTNTRSRFGLNYQTESSTNLKKNLISNLESFKNNFIGLTYQHKILNNNFYFNDKFFLEVKLNIGKRKTNEQISNQNKLNTIISYLFNFNFKNSLYLKNTTGLLTSNLLLTNELYRIGGPNSIRGFREQSIFSDKFTYFNIEYRYLTSKTSYLYTISDYGLLKNKSLLGIGLGYSFNKNNSSLNINTVFGNDLKTNFELKNPQLNLIYTVFF